MKTLIVSVDYPLPENKGSRMRTMHFARFFLQHGDVDLLCYQSHAPSQAMRSPFRKVHYVDVVNNHRDDNILKAVWEKLVESKPWIVQNFGEESIRYVHDLVQREDYDVILCRYSINAYPLLGLPANYRQRVILDIDDIMSGDLYDAINGTHSGLTRIKAALDKVVLRRYQVKCLQLGSVLFCSEDDRSSMSGGHAENAFVVPNIVPKQEMPADYRPCGFDNDYLLFVGTLSYQPNEMGISWFIREIFEKLPPRHEGLRLLVVGKDPREELRDLCAANDRIDLVANPPSVVPFFEKCRAVIVPVLAGGGTRIKILEAGSCLRPVLSTPLGAYGLGLEGGKHLLYFDDLESFEKSLDCLQTKENYRQLTDNLGQVVANKYGEGVFARMMDSVLARSATYEEDRCHESVADLAPLP